MDIFLETAVKTESRRNNLNRLITVSATEFVIKKKKQLSADESLLLDGFTGDFYQTYKELMLIVPKVFQKI